MNNVNDIQGSISSIEENLKASIDEYHNISKQLKELENQKASARKVISEMIESLQLNEGNKVTASNSSMTLYRREMIAAVDFEGIEALLGDKKDEFIIKEVDLKKLRSAVDEGEVNADCLKLIKTDFGSLTFTIRGLKGKPIEA